MWVLFITFFTLLRKLFKLMPDRIWTQLNHKVSLHHKCKNFITVKHTYQIKSNSFPIPSFNHNLHPSPFYIYLSFPLASNEYSIKSTKQNHSYKPISLFTWHSPNISNYNLSCISTNISLRTYGFGTCLLWYLYSSKFYSILHIFSRTKTRPNF